MKKRTLITSGTSYIGSHTAIGLQSTGYEVVIADDLSNSNTEVLDGIKRVMDIHPGLAQLDLKDRGGTCKALEARPGIKGIILFAANEAVRKSVQQSLEYYRSNIVTLVNLLEMVPEFNIEGIVFPSSHMVCEQSDPENLPITENAPVKPAISPYGNTKQINGEIVRNTIHAGAPFRNIILRYFNPTGAHPSAEIGELPNGVPQNLTPYLTQTAIGTRKELGVFGGGYGTADGSCIRDCINAVDSTRAHVIATDRTLENKSSGHIEVFNLGTGNGVSILELINTFEQATSVEVLHKIVGCREDDIGRIRASPERAGKVLGWTVRETLVDTPQSTWNWQKRLRRRGTQ